MDLPADHDGMLARETQRGDTEKEEKKGVRICWSF
jgi:hypothetical protein